MRKDRSHREASSGPLLAGDGGSAAAARTDHAEKIVEVAAGVLARADGRVLLIRRMPGKHLAGKWEFPGGKLEPGESIRQALDRELDEELGVVVTAAERLVTVRWRYPEKTVCLHVLRVTAWHGTPTAREGNPMRWVAPSDLDPEEMPAADAGIVTALRSSAAGA